MASAARMLAALVVLLVLGAAAAQALAPGEAAGAIAPTLTVPTVSVPTVSVPLPLPTVPTLPPPPTTTTQTPLPALTAPVKSSTPTGSTTGPAGSVPPPGGPAPSYGFAPTGASGSRPYAAQSEAGPSRAARVSEVRARPIRDKRTKRRGVVIVFRLSEPDRVVFLVDGPTPMCAVVARFAVQGRAGVNRVRFFGVVRGERLAPGTYLLRPRVDGAGPRGATVTVLSGERPSAVPGPRDARCEERQARAIFVSATIRQARLERGQPAEEASGAVRGQEREEQEEQDDERSVTPGPLLPPAAEDQALPGLVGIALLVLGAASLLYIVGYVVHFLRAN